MPAARVIAILVGLILLTAAMLKGYQWAVEPTPSAALLSSRWLVLGIVQIELLFGLWLLSGLYPRQTWGLAIICFSGFLGFALYQALAGAESCGCFGKVKVNPWYTAGFDVLVLGALLAFRPAPGAAGAVRYQSARLAAVVLLALAIGLPAGIVMARSQPSTIAEDGAFVGDSRLVVLEPEKWVGQRLPLLGYIDIGQQLAEGNWTVLLYRHDCPDCRAALPKYEGMAHEFAQQGNPSRIALIELPPYAGARFISPESPLVVGKLSDEREWFVRTPASVALADGIVRSVPTER